MNIRKVGKILLYLLAGCVCFVLFALIATKLALDRVPRYQAEIKAWVFRETGLHVAFAHVSPTLRWYGPELLFDQLELRSRDDRRVLARAASGRIGADLRQFLRSGNVFAGRIELVGPDLTIVRLGPDSFALAAEIELNLPASANEAITLEDLPAGTLEIRAGRLALRNWNPSMPQLLLEKVNLVMQRDSNAIAIAFDAALPKVLGGELRANGSARGLANSSTLDWNGNMRAHDVSFAGWREFMPEYLTNLRAGDGDFTLAAAGRGADVSRAQLDFAAHAVETRLDEGSIAKFDQIGGFLTLDHTGDRWTLSGRRVLARRADINDPLSQFDVTWRNSDAGLLELRASASYLRADSLLPLTGLLPQPELRARLLEIAPTGIWSDALLELSRGSAADPWNMRAFARFRDAGFAPVGKVPGFRGLSGEIAGNQSGGHVTLDCESLLMAWPTQWAQPVGFDSLQGTFYWNRTADNLTIATPSIELRNPDAEAHAQAALQLPANGDSPQLAVAAQVADGNVSSTRYYLPRGVISAPALAWLDQAFVAGHVSKGEVIFQGSLRQFPFRDGGGVFVARVNVDGMVMNFGDGWPLMEGMTARAEFRNEGLSVQLTGGETQGIKVDRAEARFVDFKTGELQVHAEGGADALAALGYLRATPLNALTDGAFYGFDGKGPVSVGVDLFLPFKEFENRRVLVHAQLNGVSLNHPGLPISASDLRGGVDIDGGNVARADILGQVLGGAVHVTAKAAKKRPLVRTQLDLHGSLNGEALRAALGLPAELALPGAADWQGTIVIAQAPERERSVHLSTNFVGLDSELPEPLRKPTTRSLPSSVDVLWPLSGGTQIAVTLGPVARAAFTFESGAGDDKLTHAAVMFGSGDPVYADNQILSVGGRIERLGLDGWQTLMEGGDKGARPLAYYLQKAKLDVERIDTLGITLRKVGLSLDRTKDHWQLTFDGPNTDGTVTVPSEGPEPWDLQFTRVRLDDDDDNAKGLPAPVAAAAAAKSIGPASIPALKIHVDEMNWGDRHLGDVEATVSKADDGVTLDQLTMTAPTFSIRAQGEWRGKDAGLGRVAGVLQSSDVRTTMTQLGYADAIAAKSGRLDFDFNWLGAPDADSLRDAVGHLQIALDKGQIFAIKPGAGRVLGLASIAEIPRRLSLDFSDLTDKGMAFDTVRGDFDLRGGNAYTDNVLVKGPAAEIGIIGRVGLKNRDYDQTAVVTGSFGNSLVVPALAGGPVVAGAVLLFTQVFKQPLKGLARGYYRITGSWDNPVVEKIKSSGAAAAAAASTEVAK
jgi:uncharacterized protein (TIGR02099 family)